MLVTVSGSPVAQNRKTCGLAAVTFKNHILQLCPNKTGHSQMVSGFEEAGRKWGKEGVLGGGVGSVSGWGVLLWLSALHLNGVKASKEQ